MQLKNTGRSGDRQDRHGSTDEQAGDEESADKSDGGVVDLGDGHGRNSLIFGWSDDPALMPNRIAGAVPVSLFPGNPRFSGAISAISPAFISISWGNFPFIGIIFTGAA